MTLSRAEAKQAEAYLNGLPGKRGKDIPSEHYDRIHAVASSITQPLWGRPPTPHQMQALWESGALTPDAIHAAFGELPHPHAPNVKVREFPDYVMALQAHEEHSR